MTSRSAIKLVSEVICAARHVDSACIWTSRVQLSIAPKPLPRRVPVPVPPAVPPPPAPPPPPTTGGRSPPANAPAAETSGEYRATTLTLGHGAKRKHVVVG